MDSSSNGGAYQEEVSLAPGHLLDMIDGDIPDEEESALVVYISRRLILDEVSAQTGLAHKYSSVTGEDGFVKACVVVDVPQVPGRPQEKTRAFYGERKGDLDSALESAAEVALDHLVDEYGIIIDDWNYSAYVEAREELEALRKVIRDNQLLDGLVQEVKDVCLQFGDLLPVRAGGPCDVEYVGPPSPTGRFDKLALDLVQFLQSAYVE